MATVVLVARVGQSLAHISSGRMMAVNVRFAFFLTQLVSFALMAVAIYRHAAPKGLLSPWF